MPGRVRVKLSTFISQVGCATGRICSGSKPPCCPFSIGISIIATMKRVSFVRRPRAPDLPRWRGRVVLACALGLLLAGCRPEPPADLVIINGNEPESLDPAIVTGMAEMRITKALFEGLLRLDGKNGRPVAALAEHWEVSPAGTLYTFHLRTNAVWSTGEPITTTDVLYSWRRALDPTTAADYAGQLFYIKNAEEFYLGKIKDPDQVGIRALDAHTLQVELNYPLAFFLDLCCFP